MRTIAIAALLLVAAIATPVVVDQLDLKSGDDFVAEVQGDNQNVYIIVFEKTDKNYLTNLKKALDNAPNDDTLKAYNFWQADFDDGAEHVDETDTSENKKAKKQPHIKIGQIDVRDQSAYQEALDLIGANDPNFKMTYPVALISKQGKGYIASFTDFTDKDGNKLSQHLKEKLIEVSGALKKKPAAASTANTTG